MEGGASLDESLDYLWRHDPDGRAAGMSKAEYARRIGITTTLGERNRRTRECSLSDYHSVAYHCPECRERSKVRQRTVE